MAIRTHLTRMTLFWMATVLVGFELVASFIWVVVGTQYVAANLRHLGYPPYLERIIGVFDLPGAVTLLAPGFTRLKEWAYAGAFFKYSGAIASHVFAGDGPDKWAAPLVFATLTLASWALRPPERRMISASQATPASTRAWVVPIVVIASLVIPSLLTVPA
jgi:DoxX-like family